MKTGKKYSGPVELLGAVSQMIRLPNLVIIVLCQFLLRYGVLTTFLYPDTQLMSGLFPFSLLVLATLLIAAGGYIINDYFDYRIDQVNKPGKLVIDRLITSRQSIILHLVLTMAGVVLGFFLAFLLKSLSFGLIFPCIAVLLYLYSAKYKRTFLSGNLIVAFLSAFVIIIVWLFEFFSLKTSPENFSMVMMNFRMTNRIFLAYALFAFLTTFTREVIKDMEDIEGDREYLCRNLPIVLGMTKTKWVTVAVIVLNMIILGYCQSIFFRREMMIVFWYLLALVQFPSFYIVVMLAKAGTKEDYHYLSMLTKLIMFTGIISMQLISISI
jgi:4-hydroxybenzoate polyprenyltransferase